MVGILESGMFVICCWYNGNNLIFFFVVFCYSGFCGEYIVFNGYYRMLNFGEGSFILLLYFV